MLNFILTIQQNNVFSYLDLLFISGNKSLLTKTIKNSKNKDKSEPVTLYDGFGELEALMSKILFSPICKFIKVHLADDVPKNTSLDQNAKLLVTIVDKEEGNNAFRLHDKIDSSDIEPILIRGKIKLKLMAVICFRGSDHYYVIIPTKKSGSFLEIDDEPPKKRALPTKLVKPAAYLYSIERN
jgi:hypothetical protein